MTTRDEVLNILAWNVYIANTPAQVRMNLSPMLNTFDPEVAALMEAGKMHGHLSGLGYKVIQLKPKTLRPGNQPGTANIAILVRNDVEIKRRLTLRMSTFWLGPKHNLPQDPRVYRWVKIKWKGRTWKIGAAHTPFGEAARKESRNKLVRWFRTTVPGRPTILVLDANMSQAELRDKIAEPVDALTTGVGIDLAVFKNANCVSTRDLGKHGSDHPALLYGFLPK